jgi:hypothetical protein
LYDALGLEGLHFNFVTAPYDFAALCNVTREVLLTHLDDQKAIDVLFNECLALNTERVRVAHGTWINSPGGLYVYHPDRRRWDATPYHYESRTEVARLAKEAMRLRGEFHNRWPPHEWFDKK